jgi:hypothetical protein
VLHLPVIFVTASVFTFEDLKKMGKWILLVSLPMTVLMLLQYEAPSEAWLNKGATADAIQLPSALGHIRPAGTFSFVTGPMSFVPLVGAFVLWGLSTKGLYPRWLLISSGIALVILVPFSGSRTIALEIGALLALAFFGGLIRGTLMFNPAKVPQIVAGIIGAVVLSAFLYSIPFVQDGILTFTTRWNGANEAEGGATSAIESRGLGGFTRVFEDAAGAPFFGTGIGSASNFASAYQQGYVTFALGEGAWERELYELGSFGLIFLGLRMLLTILLVIMAFRALKKNSILSWYLLSGCVVNLLTGLLDQPTSQGFFIFGAALILTGINNSTGKITSPPLVGK